MTILITGATGFVGRAVTIRVASKSSYRIRVVTRRRTLDFPDQVEQCVIADLASIPGCGEIVKDARLVIHAAARVHVMSDHAVDPLSEFRKVNVDGTLNLARQAAQAGVKRFIFISSIKVNGEVTLPNQPFHADDASHPLDPYGISKMEAEDGLRKLSQETGMEVVIIRPPLVYGPGVKANFRAMMGWLNKGVPLPFGAIDNRRSLVALDNLVDLIVTCIEHPSAANQTFLVSDGEDLSTTELLRRTAKALGKPVRLIPVPQFMLESGLRMLGKGDLAQRLCGSLQVDISKTRELLGWVPPVSVDDALRKTAEDFLARKA